MFIFFISKLLFFLLLAVISIGFFHNAYNIRPIL